MFSRALLSSQNKRESEAVKAKEEEKISPVEFVTFTVAQHTLGDERAGATF